MNTSERTHELDKIGTRFDQFIIAVNVALIAYAFKQVENKELTLELIPLGFAIFFWGLSFYFGVTSVRKLISTRILDIFRSTNDIIRKNPEYIEMARKKFNKVGRKANSYNKKMFLFLYLGGGFYLIWQVLEMYMRTYYNS